VVHPDLLLSSAAHLRRSSRVTSGRWWKSAGRRLHLGFTERHGEVGSDSAGPGGIVHDTAVLAPAPGATPQLIVPLPDADGTRAVVVPTGSPTTFTPGQ
jgi:hypothetical protein